MAVDTRHPEYDDVVLDWQIMRDCYKGERAIKDKGTKYLPKSYSQSLDTTGAEYFNYKQRSAYHDFVSTAVKAALGIMHRKPPTINLPSKMEQMRHRATPFGESLNILLRKINFEQLVTGRCGVMLDMLSTPSQKALYPYIALYPAEKIINWDVGSNDDFDTPELNLVVLDERENERQGDFTWKDVEKYRVLRLEDGVYQQSIHRKVSEGIEEQGGVLPVLTGKALNSIPFRIINATDTAISVDSPPLLGLAMLTLTIYRTEADYRQAMFMTCQDTLVITGQRKDEELIFGAGKFLQLPSPSADAKMVGVSGAGIGEIRQAIQYDISRALKMSGELFTSKTSDEASGDALKIRVAAQTATLVQVAQAGAVGLEAILKKAGEWMGLPESDIDEIKVIPNVDFVDDMLGSRDIMEITAAKANGLPLSWKSIHANLKKHEWTEKTFEEEMEEISEEAMQGGVTQEFQNLTGGAVNIPASTDNSQNGNDVNDSPVQ